jgi:2-polyprenyl-3-methyl-5-hydroxy-6-metoxy-1,4-benzoquinol methylase
MDHHYGPDYHALIAAGAETSQDRWKPHLDTMSKYKVSGALLDLGCSSGSFLASLKGPSWNLHGIEMAADSAKRAEARSGARVFTGDILGAPFSPESFDVITCFDVLEHLYEPRTVMARIWNWLKPDGIFYTVVPNIESAEARIFRSYWYPLELPRHLSHFSPRSLRRLASLVGLQEVALITQRCSKVEYNLHYIYDDLLAALGVSRQPLATAPSPGIPWKVARKMLRLTIFPLIARVTSLVGPGETIHAVFRKEGRSGPASATGASRPHTRDAPR